MSDSNNKKPCASAKGGDAPTPQHDRKGGDALSDRELFRRIVMSKYLPMADREPYDAPLLLTSRDLQYQVRDMCTVSVSTVAGVLTELGYSLTFAGGSPVWRLYEVLAE